ncbi:MAG: hypothetical protein AVDCRST_MAG38-174, partial [uncultured Solirubrobacteraceae bacterium]
VHRVPSPHHPSRPRGRRHRPEPPGRARLRERSGHTDPRRRSRRRARRRAGRGLRGGDRRSVPPGGGSPRAARHPCPAAASASGAPAADRPAPRIARRHHAASGL